MNRLRVVLQIVFVILFLAGGAFVARKFIEARRMPPKIERKIPAPLVFVKQVNRQAMPVVVRGYGTVEPRTVVGLVPEVGGKVISVHEELVSGGFVNAEETLIQIDPRDYELAVQQAEANIERAKVQLEIEEAEADVARKEWQAMRPGAEPESPLVFREAQIKQARAELAAAEANLSKAELDLTRTRIILPYDGRVVSETVDMGQFVAVGQSLATIYATDVVEIAVPLEDKELVWFEAPLTEDGLRKGSGAEVEVTAAFAGGDYHWQGRIVRCEGQIDRRSRMVHVIVEVKNPFKVKEGQPPLTPGMFVNVAIEGKTLDDIYVVPRHAVHNKNEVWRVNGEQLEIVEVEIERDDKDAAYISAGLDDGDLIVTSPMDVVTDGMKVRVNVGRGT